MYEKKSVKFSLHFVRRHKKKGMLCLLVGAVVLYSKSILAF